MKAQPFAKRAVIACAQANPLDLHGTTDSFRNTGAARARHAKAMLLPIARQIADDLALRVHLSLDWLRRGVGTKNDAQTLTQIMLLTSYLADAGFESMSHEELRAANSASAMMFDAGRERTEWHLDDAGFELFASIATVRIGNSGALRFGRLPRPVKSRPLYRGWI